MLLCITRLSKNYGGIDRSRTAPPISIRITKRPARHNTDENDSVMTSAISVRFIGSGDAFGSGGRFQTCILLEGNTERALIDCGASSLVALKASGTSPATITRTSVRGSSFEMKERMHHVAVLVLCFNSINSGQLQPPGCTPSTFSVLALRHSHGWC